MSDNRIVEVLIKEIEENLKEYKTQYEGFSWRNKVLLLVKVYNTPQKLGA